ncbi:hypothetical protein BX600DRAFT_516601 [Xylariales sp. PMI_506]|nr:hypothetical protein BX600DRAFT_516601 [Xylariales sp. PMI_506]
MALISARTREPNVQLLGQQSAYIAALGPAIKLATICQQILSTVSAFLLIRSYYVALNLLFVSRVIAVQSALMSKLIIWKTAVLTRWTSWLVWNSQPIKRLRKKVQFEFFAFILGGGGNNVFLLMFWPGWWVVGVILFTVWACAG